MLTVSTTMICKCDDVINICMNNSYLVASAGNLTGRPLNIITNLSKSSLCRYPGGGGTQYKSGYRDVPQTWVAKSGRQVHQWVPFFSKTWYFDGSIFQNFLKFAPKWRKFGTLMVNFLKFSEISPKWRKFQRKILIFGTWMGHFSFKMGTWMGGISKIPAAHPYPDQSWVPPPPGAVILWTKLCAQSISFWTTNNILHNDV